jgi:GNAT superfamily N-acetyltransferase
MERQRILAQNGLVIARDGLGVNGYSRLERGHFSRLADKIAHNDQLLHPTDEVMAQSYNAGKAVALFNTEHEPIGFARVIDALTPEVRAGLYLREDFPRLVEIGTVYIDPQYQGRGLNPVMQNELLSTIQEEIEAKRLLAMLTTKTQKVVNSFNRAEELGMTFEFMLHTDPRAAMIAPFTCTCGKEHDTSFGSGFHIGGTIAERAYCSKRVQEPELVTIKRKADLAKAGEKPIGDPKLACVFGVSDAELMQQMNDELYAHFARVNAYCPQEALVQRLVHLGYYE